MFNGEGTAVAATSTSAPYPKRRPTQTEERVAGLYKKLYRLDFNSKELIGLIEDQLVAWSHELIGQKASKEMFRVAQMGVALGLEIGTAIGKKKDFDDLMSALRERLPHYNLNFSL